MTESSSRVIATFEPLKVERLDNGNIRLDQDYGNGDSAIVDLHPLQARFIGSLVSTYQDPDIEAQNAVKRLAHQLRTLNEQIDVVVNGFWENTSFVKGYENDFLMAQADSLRILADSFVAMLDAETLSRAAHTEAARVEPATDLQREQAVTGDLFAADSPIDLTARSRHGD